MTIRTHISNWILYRAAIVRGCLGLGFPCWHRKAGILGFARGLGRAGVAGLRRPFSQEKALSTAPLPRRLLLYYGPFFCDNAPVMPHWRQLLSPVLLCSLATRLWAGGSGLNVVVVVNQDSTNSLQLGNYYCERRQVPPQNVLFINWTGGNLSWTSSDFSTYVFNPLVAMLSSRQLTNQVDYVVLSMDIPYRVTSTASQSDNSTTSSLFYGFKPDPNAPCSIAAVSTSAYAGSEGIFRSTPPISASSNSFLVTMITASNLPSAQLVVDQGVNSDSTFPAQTVFLARSSDVNRNVRYSTFDNAIFNTRLRGNYSMQRTNSDLDSIYGNILGLQSGVFYSQVSPTTFVPGAMADNLTSFGGSIFENTGGHLDILLFSGAGAAGTYGTLSEPCNYLAKFPSPQNYFYQARGFSLAECYYLSLTNPYQGLLLGEPLAAPFAQPATGAWNNLPVNALLSGTTNLSFQCTASDTNHPVQQVDLFLDGLWMQTLTNIALRQNNTLTVKVNGTSMTYTVPASATIASVATGLTSTLNGKSSTTKVTAIAHGDRIELQSTDSTKLGSQLTLSASSAIGTATALTTFVAASGTAFLDTIAYGIRSYQISGTPAVGSYLKLVITKTNNVAVTIAITNTTSGTTVSALTQGLVNMVNTNAALPGSDGVAAEDFIGYDPTEPLAQFNLRALSPGWNAALATAALTGSSVFTITPTGTVALNGNLTDLEPRAHLYVTAGITNTLPLAFGFNTTTQANGYHELTAVAYEGSHVRTQQRVAQTVNITNSALSATFTTPFSGTNVALEATLQFSVTANTNNISKIELFGIGGSLGNVTGVSNTTFSVTGASLGIGLHPFYALVTASSGKQYRTQTKWIRLVGADSPFRVSISSAPPKLSWPATALRSYDILSATNVTNAYLLRTSITPTNTPAQWTETNATAPRRFYRIRTSQ